MSGFHPSRVTLGAFARAGIVGPQVDFFIHSIALRGILQRIPEAIPGLNTLVLAGVATLVSSFVQSHENLKKLDPFELIRLIMLLEADVDTWTSAQMEMETTTKPNKAAEDAVNELLNKIRKDLL